MEFLKCSITGIGDSRKTTCLKKISKYVSIIMSVSIAGTRIFFIDRKITNMVNV